MTETAALAPERTKTPANPNSLDAPQPVLVTATPTPAVPPPAVIVKNIEDAMVLKSNTPWQKLLLAGISGGAFVALGFVLFVTTQQGLAGSAFPVGIGRLIGGIAFSAGLILILHTGADIFTGAMLNIIPVLSKRLAWQRAINHWWLSYVANIIGALIIVGLLFLGGTQKANGGAYGLVALNIANAKLSLGWTEALVLGILANWLVCLAVWLTFTAKQFLDRVVAIIVPLAVFISSGFEHSIANLFVLPFAWLLRNFGGEFWQSKAVLASGATPEKFPGITLDAILWNNLLPVTIGNVIGGALFVGLFYWYSHRRDTLAKTQ
ncbi:MAG: formate/nitrite transporter family protein [Microbacteriaceae bacterium]|nr:formate/nitrite transporter family protein [Microbacteriaceae bacterium]